MKNKLKVSATLIGLLLIVAIIFGMIYKGVLNRNTIIESNTETSINDTKDEEKSGIKEMLKEQGIDTDKLDKEHTTDNGATVLGDALPVKTYKSLAEAESSFGYYLGLHNKIDSVDGYNLVAMNIIDKEIMQGVYEDSTATKSITIKTSKVKNEEELISMYSKFKEEFKKDIQGVEVNISGNSKDILNKASFSVKNGKSYSIYTLAGLKSDDMYKLLTELINNLKSMDDWKE